ncbi:arylsulfatase [Cytophagaceae bacterium 50C-KIRBA]|uniref:Arylsulfatase n=1 Tax=Aquirufa beregesia TaxID=2516556 RepID=A0ABX0EZU6_9BACT|nr:arylsulfatase [Aquirufa beregesia]NGZ44958.1 arylsulfatase [Aquirufa beregesia]
MKHLFLFLFLISTPLFAQKKPNIIVVLADDMGYSDIGLFGSEIKTPNLDALGQKGAAFTQFYNAGRCCPSRTSLLTGMYPHQAGMGLMVTTGKYDHTKPYQPYQGFLSLETPTIAEELRKNGYQTFMSGKWHVGEQQEDWPNQRGFDHYFGLISGANSYYEVLSRRQLVEDNKKYVPNEHFYMTEAISDKAISYVKSAQAQKPFFLYVAYTAPHWPLHAPVKLIDQYRETYRKGWEKLRADRFARQQKSGLLTNIHELPPIDPAIARFDTIKNPSVYIDKMATYAAMMQIMDEGIGRIMQEVKAKGEWENTMFVFLSDNGACHEILDDRSVRDLGEAGYQQSLITPVGAKGSYTTYGKEWASAGNTPFRMYKHWMHEGGISTPLIVHFPKLIKKGFRTNQVGHIMDLFPTFLDVSHSTPSKPVQGKSLLPILNQKTRAAHPFIAWEHQGNRAIREGDWKLVWDDEIKQWELYNLKKDRIEAHDLAKQMPEKRNDLLNKYTQWAQSLGVK